MPRYHERRRTLAALLAALVVAAPTSVAAEDAGSATEATRADAPGTGVIRGRVTGLDGKKPAAGCVVHAYHLSGEKVYSSPPSNRKGEYLIESVPYGWFRLVVSTDAGHYPANEVVNVPPGGKAVASLRLSGYKGGPGAPGAERPAGVPGLDGPAAGLAALDKRAVGKEFWKGPKGVAVLLGSTAALLLIAAGGGDDDVVASPFAP